MTDTEIVRIVNCLLHPSQFHEDSTRDSCESCRDGLPPESVYGKVLWIVKSALEKHGDAVLQGDHHFGEEYAEEATQKLLEIFDQREKIVDTAAELAETATVLIQVLRKLAN